MFTIGAMSERQRPLIDPNVVLNPFGFPPVGHDVTRHLLTRSENVDSSQNELPRAESRGEQTAPDASAEKNSSTK